MIIIIVIITFVKYDKVGRLQWRWRTGKIMLTKRKSDGIGQEV